jgi:hypothetical protein
MLPNCGRRKRTFFDVDCRKLFDYVDRMKHLASAREVIDALGGIKDVAVLTGRRPTTVSAWQAKFDSFPPSTYLVMVRALLPLGYTAPASLWRQEAADA